MNSLESKNNRSSLDANKNLVIKTQDQNKLRMINECSRRFYNLNLIMNVIEHQTSIFDKLCLKNELKSEANHDSSDYSDKQIQSLLQNILNLQEKAEKMFKDFNQSLEGNF